MTRYEEILAPYSITYQAPLNRASHAVSIPLIMTSVIAATSYARLARDGVWVHANFAMALAAFTVTVVLSWSAAAGFAYLVLVIASYAAALR